jgi:hypothetical protein
MAEWTHRRLRRRRRVLTMRSLAVMSPNLIVQRKNAYFVGAHWSCQSSESLRRAG